MKVILPACLLVLEEIETLRVVKQQPRAFVIISKAILLLYVHDFLVFEVVEISDRGYLFLFPCVVFLGLVIQ